MFLVSHIQYMKSYFLLITLIIISACTVNTSDAPETTIEKGTTSTNQVIVLGMIHSGHLSSSRYSISLLTDLIQEIDPDIILTEIPPDRFDQAKQEFEQSGFISEPRVSVFPEYTQVVFPLTRKLDFQIIPTAGWTQQMASARSQKLNEIAQDTSRIAEWSEYQRALQESGRAVTIGGRPDDPYWIHTDEYDQAQEIGLSVYNRLFNDELGPGGWDNINTAHYSNIEKALDENSDEGLRILITYGAAHKGWFLRELRQRDDITLLDVKPFLDAIK